MYYGVAGGVAAWTGEPGGGAGDGVPSTPPSPDDRLSAREERNLRALLVVSSLSTLATRAGLARSAAAWCARVRLLLPADACYQAQRAATRLVGVVNPVAGVNAATLRQAVTPERFRGRVTAVSQVVTWGGVTCGALVGGVAAEHLGLRPTVALAGLLPLAGFLWLWCSPVRSLRDVPTPVAA